jgi:hypothetical protein
VIRINRQRNRWIDKKLRALERITEIEVLLHRHGFAGDYTYTELEERLGNKIYETADRSKNYRSDSYRKTGWVGFNNRKLRLFWSRKHPCLPLCKIEISNPGQEYLARLNEALPNLEPYLIEYTVDLYCSSWIAVRRLFEVLVRYIYVPWGRRPKCHRGHSSNNRQSSALNRTCYISRLKIYERGDDKIPWGKGWLRKELNRVRVEFKANRQVLRDNGIQTLGDLLRNCNFEEVFMKHFEFKIFEGSIILPTENGSYCRVRGLESFHQELWLARRRGSPQNPTQYMVDDPGFEELKEQVIEAIEEFDRDWCDNYQIIFSNRIIRAVRRRVHS